MDIMEEWAELLQIPLVVHGGFHASLTSRPVPKKKNAVTFVSMAVTCTLLSLAASS